MLHRWKKDFQQNAPNIFLDQRDPKQKAKAQGYAPRESPDDLKKIIGNLTIQNEILKKSSGLLFHWQLFSPQTGYRSRPHHSERATSHMIMSIEGPQKRVKLSHFWVGDHVFRVTRRHRTRRKKENSHENSR